MNKPKIIVIGAGIVGVSAAIWLKRAGQDVTLIDRDTPGMGTSYGNAGVLAACSVAPVTAPGLVLKGPKLLLDPNFPLFARLSYLPKIAPWLVRYLSHANDKDTRRIAHGLTAIVGDCVQQHLDLSGGTSADKWVQQSNYCFAYPDRAAFDADAYTWALRKEAGFEPTLVEGEDVQDVEPTLNPSINLLAVMKDHGFVLDPGSYVGELAKVFQEMGGTFVQAEVRGFDLSGGNISGVETDKGRFKCERAVLSTGVWSKPLMQKLGLDVPLESERGYHIIFKNPSEQPKTPIMITNGKFVATPMSAGFRCAGIVEFGGLDAGPCNAPLKQLRRKVHEAFPNMTAESEEEWLGHRPAPSDSLPIIGEIGQTGVFAAFGHHHIGLTGGPKTGRMVADLVTENTPKNDMTPYNPMRFARGAN